MGEVKFVPAIGRTIETQKRYMQHLQRKHETGDTSCDLCSSIERQDVTGAHPTLGDSAIRLTNDYFTLIDNDFPYEIYDGQQVLTHHMLVPREHVDYDTVQRDKKLRHEFADAEYELLQLSLGAYGTNMARASSSVASSIRQHAHKHFFITGSPIIEQRFSVSQQQNDFLASIDALPKSA